MKNSLVTAQNEITSLKGQLDVKEKLLKTYQDRATSADPMPKVKPLELPQNAFQPIIAAPNREKKVSMFTDRANCGYESRRNYRNQT